MLRLLDIVKGDQERRLPDPNKGRKPAGVVDNKTGDQAKSDPAANETWMTVELAAHYLKFAAAVYGSSYIYALKDLAGSFTWIWNMFR